MSLSLNKSNQVRIKPLSILQPPINSHKGHSQTSQTISYDTSSQLHIDFNHNNNDMGCFSSTEQSQRRKDKRQSTTPINETDQKLDAKVSKLFEQYDLNKDEQLQRDEVVAMLGDMMGGREHVTEEMADKFIKSCDKDQNGSIDKGELKRMLKQKMRKMYQEMADDGEKQVMGNS